MRRAAAAVLLACGAPAPAPQHATVRAATPVASVAPPPKTDPCARVATSQADRDQAKLVLDGARDAMRGNHWEEAAPLYERAAKLDPNDARVLAERGYDAMLLERWDVAESASKAALCFADAPELRAQILYNLGRTAQAQDQEERAIERYRASLALRANGEVADQLATVKPDFPMELHSLFREACLTAKAAAAACACMRKWKGIAVDCAERPNPTLATAGITVLAVTSAQRDTLGGDLMLYANEPSGLRLLGTTNIATRAEVVGVEEQKVAGHRMLTLTVDHTYDETTARARGGVTSRASVVCVEDHGWKCPLDVTLDLTERVDSLVGDRETARRHWKLALAIGDDGVATVRALVGVVPRGFVGTRKLW